MAKGKKVQERLRQYYRGTLRRPTRVANEDDMKVITTALLECVPQRFKSVFKIQWGNDCVETQVRLVIGLSASLRHLKRKETLALVYDDTASIHLANMLIDMAHKHCIPIVKAQRLIHLAPQMKLKTLLTCCLVKVKADLDEEITATTCLDVPSFREFATLLQNSPKSEEGDKYTFKMGHLDHVKSTSRSKAKKEVKRAAKKMKQS